MKTQNKLLKKFLKQALKTIERLEETPPNTVIKKELEEFKDAFSEKVGIEVTLRKEVKELREDLSQKIMELNRAQKEVEKLTEILKRGDKDE